MKKSSILGFLFGYRDSEESFSSSKTASGTKMRNFIFECLWLNKTMPNIAPKPPIKNAKSSKTFSLIRLLCAFASILSMPKTIQTTILQTKTKFIRYFKTIFLLIWMYYSNCYYRISEQFRCKLFEYIFYRWFTFPLY